MDRPDAAALARTLMLRVIEQHALRDLAIQTVADPPWTRLHQAADRHRPALERHVRHAFQIAAQEIHPVSTGDFAGLETMLDAAMVRFERALRDGLGPLLLRAVRDGGTAASKNLTHASLLKAAQMRAGGDFVGHPFRGNQWVSLNLDKNGYTPEGKPGPALARRHGALWRYRGSGTDINDQLRDDDLREPEVRDTLDAAMKPLGHDMTLIRDIGHHPSSSAKPGDIIEEKGYTSTATERGTFAKGNTIRIDVPAHAPAIRIGDYYAKDPEKEIILGRGARFKIITPTHWRWVESRTAGDFVGHPFRGNQWTTYYHGTSAQSVKDILEHGIKTDRFGLVFTSPALLEAKTYARDKGDDAVVLELSIPETHPRSPNPLHASGVFTETIKPEWIRRVHSTFDASTRTWRTAGDFVGHPFRGNQWTTGESDHVRDVVNDALSEMEDRQADPREHHLGIDAETGERLFDVIGDAGGPTGQLAQGIADPSFEDLRPSAGVVPYDKVHDKHVIDIHTHPTYMGTEARGGLFSDGDLGYFTGSHIDTMMVVDSDSVGVLKKTPAFLAHQEKAWKGHAKPWTPARARTRYNEIIDELTTPDKTWDVQQVMHDALKQVVDEMGATFTVMPRARAQKRTAGDYPGHPFHGNQWTSGSAFDRERRGPLPSTGPFVPDENFRREVGTTADEMRAEGLPDSLHAAENRIRAEPNEHGFVIRDGKVVEYRGNDRKNYILLDNPKDVEPGALGDPYTNAILTHNHPSGSGLSPDDGYVASSHNMLEMRAVVPGGAHVIRRDGDRWPSVEQLRTYVEDIGDEVRKDLTAKVSTQRMSVAEANQLHWRLVWSEVADKTRYRARFIEQGSPTITYHFESKE